jgi:hypothetical protein
MKRAKRHPPLVPKPRNPLAGSPLLGKGHAHQESRKAKRQRGRAEIGKVLAHLADE